MKASEPRGLGYLLEPIAPPIIWISYFMIVYLVAEAGCAMDLMGDVQTGIQGVNVITIVATLLSAGAIGFFTLRSWRRFKRADNEGSSPSQDRSLALMGVLSGTFFIVASLYVGLPALVMAPC